VGRYRREITLVPIFVFLDVICELSMPLLMSRIVDVGIPGQDVAYIARIGLYMVLRGGEPLETPVKDLGHGYDPLTGRPLQAILCDSARLVGRRGKGLRDEGTAPSTSTSVGWPLNSD
jgi:hypothetical protein